ncbi:tail fiber assembly protein [Desulfovibrio piger]
MSRVTVVPADRLVIVDGLALTFDFNAPKRMHALQWDGKQGHIEWLGSGDEPPHNEPLAADSYAGQVAPYVELWKEEKARLEQAAAEAEAARLAEYNSEEARFERLRSERDQRLAATDYLLMPDYPLSDDQRTILQVYRQALRDLPSQEGAPWDGGAEDTPWPEIPNWVKA